MGTTTKISFEEFQKLQDAADETVRYALDEGELIATPSITPILQYLAGGSQSVWVIYPALRVIEIHDSAGTRVLTESEPIREEHLFPGHEFYLSLSNLFSENPEV